MFGANEHKTDFRRVDDITPISTAPLIACKNSVGVYIGEVYVMYKSGLVLISRRFLTGSVSSEPQLVGGFISALSEFIRSVLNDHTCQHFGDHELLDIGTSCSRWMLNSHGDFTIAILIPNDSPLIQKGLWHVINEFSERIGISFDIFYQFVNFKETTLLMGEDYSKDFGNTIDYLLFETLSEFTDENIVFDDNSPAIDEHSADKNEKHEEEVPY